MDHELDDDAPDFGSETPDSRPLGWSIDDEVVQLRHRGTGLVFAMPTFDQREYLLPGRARLVGYVSRFAPEELATLLSRNAKVLRFSLYRGRSSWCVADLHRVVHALAPGGSLKIGASLYIAESQRSIRLRERLASLSTQFVDDALALLRSAQVSSAPLVLRGDRKAIKVAQELHELMHLAPRPFVAYDSRRGFHGQAGSESFYHLSGEEALAVSRGGTLYLSASDLPPDHLSFIERRIREEHTQSLLFIQSDARARLSLSFPHSTLSLRNSKVR
jgi:hypothetical protein